MEIFVFFLLYNKGNMLRNREKVINMKKGKKQAKRRNANVTMAFGIREKIVLCFLVPVLFMIVLGIISYRKAADGMSSSYRDSTQQTIEMALQNIDTSNSFISAEALKYVVDSDLGKYFVGIYDNDPTSKRTLIDQVKTRILASQVGNSCISNIYIIPSGDLQMISTKNKAQKGIYHRSTWMRWRLMASWDSGMTITMRWMSI